VTQTPDTAKQARVNPNALTLPSLYSHLTSDGLTHKLFELARREDLGPTDLDATTLAMRLEGAAEASVVVRAPGVCAGLASIGDLIEAFDSSIASQPRMNDGDRFSPGQTIATITGPTTQILAIERTLLNLLGRLSGIATLTSAFVERVAGTGARILDTRKTTPGWRALENYAVRCGGGYCHRLGLHDAVLIKDNHIAFSACGESELADRIRDAAEHARTSLDIAFVEVEVDTLAQLDAVLSIDTGVIDVVLLDNMPAPTLHEAVHRRNERSPGLLLEASGGVTLETVGEIARTGVDRISIGALTHQAVSLDLGLDIR